jgi:hypothetical protein
MKTIGVIGLVAVLVAVTYSLRQDWLNFNNQWTAETKAWQKSYWDAPNSKVQIPTSMDSFHKQQQHLDAMMRDIQSNFKPHIYIPQPPQPPKVNIPGVRR